MANDKVDQVEHQVRLCDTPQNIIKGLLPSKINQNKIDTFYIETSDRQIKKHGWTIRIRSSEKKVELSIKKNISNGVSIPGMECEYDAHADILEKKCKLDIKITQENLSDVFNLKKNWTDILSPTQKVLLINENVLFRDAKIYGTLTGLRSKWNHSFGEMTLDLTQLKSDQSITYHEISLRYPLRELQAKKKILDTFVNESGVVLCQDQIDWSIDKFDVFQEMN